MGEDDKIRSLERKIEQLTNSVGILEDTHNVRCLQHKYGYYLDKCLYEEVVDLFAEDGEARFMGGIISYHPQSGWFEEAPRMGAFGREALKGRKRVAPGVSPGLGWRILEP